MPFTAQDLIEGRPEPVSVRRETLVTGALRLMIEHDYSQLPVIDEEKRVLGLVTSDSILRGISYLGVSIEALKVRDVMVRVHAHSREDNISDLLERLDMQPAVPIVDAEDRLVGIVTNWDTANYFRLRAEAMMWIEDIETALKEHIRAAFTDEKTGDLEERGLAEAIHEVSTIEDREFIRKSIGRYISAGESTQRPNEKRVKEVISQLLDMNANARSLDDLTLSQLTDLLLHKSRWPKYSVHFSVNERGIRKLLDKVRETRNILFHFRDELTDTQRDELRFCADWFDQHPPPIVVRVKAGKLVTGVEVTGVHPADEIAPTEEELAPEESRYARLALHLQSLPEDVDRVRLTFDEIEEIIDSELPPSARKHRSWWTNDSVSHSQAREWLEAGWRTSNINISEGAVLFTRTTRERDRAYIDFFSQVLDELRRRGFPVYEGANPLGASWINAVNFPRSGGREAILAYAFTHRKRFRVEFYISTGDKDKNKRIFDLLRQQKEEIEAALGDELTWERLESKNAARIALYHPGSIDDSAEDLAKLRAWAVDAMIRFERAIADRAEEAIQQATQDGGE